MPRARITGSWFSWSFSLEPAGRQVHLRPGQRLAGRLHGGLARAAVLLVLASLAGVAALDFGGVGLGNRHFDDALDAPRPVRFGMHGEHTLARVAVGVRRID